MDVHGDFPVYEMFPYRVRIDVENQDICVNRKGDVCTKDGRRLEFGPGRNIQNAIRFLDEAGAEH